MKKVLSMAVLVATLVASLALAEGPEEATAQDAASEGTEQVDAAAGDAPLAGTEQLYAESEAAALEETEQLYAAAAAQGNGLALFKGQCLPAPPVSKNDPIVKPYTTTPAPPEPEYTPDAHWHNFWGNKKVPSDATVDTWQVMDTKDTTCEKGDEDGGSANRKHNKSSYWMPQPYVDGEPLKPKGSGFYYSSKGGLDPTETNVTPRGLKLIAKHESQVDDDTQAAEIDIVCQAGELSLDQRVPDGQNSSRVLDKCESDRTIDIAITFPECLEQATKPNGDPNLGPEDERIAHKARNRGEDGRWRCGADPWGRPLRQIPTLQEFFTFEIPDIQGVAYEGYSSLEVAGHDMEENDHILDWTHIHADYFNAEDHADLVSRCINQEQGGISKACS